MNDTPKDVQQRYAEMLRALSPAERLQMGGRMAQCARALARAGIVAELGPQASDEEVRRRLFLRLYGDELREPQRSRALDAVTRGSRR